ncbi:hypothetical protein NQZ68_031556 [Dissostichus eleginoides]|nr:hypothetical protein NQZ68_031556 [Dissostichus eleginoides]
MRTRILSDKNHQGLLISEGLILGYRVSCWADEQNDTAVLSHKSLIKSRHEEARHDLGLQCKLWPEPNALLYHPGQDGGGSLSLV